MGHDRFLDVSADDRARVRSLVLEIQRGIACLMHEGTREAHHSGTIALAASWTELVALLAAVPRLRTAPAMAPPRLPHRPGEGGGEALNSHVGHAARSTPPFRA